MKNFAEEEIVHDGEGDVQVKQLIALVTGANRGLGFETSRQLAEQGVRVIMAARNQEKGMSAVQQLRGEGLDVEFFPLDVTNSAQIRNAVMYIGETYGRLDILVNNAGMIHPEEPLTCNSSETVAPDVLRQTLDVNFFGLVEVTQALLPLIRESEDGRIVNVASILGSLDAHSGGEMSFKPFAYDVSKTAVNAFTIHLAAALRETPIKVNSAHPGWVRTDMGGPDAPMSVEEGAKTAVRLALLDGRGPTGKFFHGSEEMPW